MSKSSSRWEGLIRASTGDVRRLGAVWRFSSIPACEYENVAEHSFWVALYGGMIHRSLCPSVEILGAVVTSCLTHDLAECVTGDVVRVFKYSTPELKAEVDRAERILSDRLPPEVKDLEGMAAAMAGAAARPWSDYVKAVVKAADFLSLFQYMRREAARGNLEIIPFYNRMADDISHMAETSGVSDASGDITDARFPESFYEELREEALAVRSDCFHGLEEDPRWTRPV